MALEYQVRPLSDLTWTRKPSERVPSRFKAGWVSTLDMLQTEFEALNGKHLVIGVDVREKDIRNDGRLRADARATSPAVEVAFETKYGPLLYRIDQYDHPPWRRFYETTDAWQHNVRGVALTLQALRAVDRHGASRSGEQYRGYRQIEGGQVGLTVDDAAAFIAQHSDDPLARLREVRSDPSFGLALFKEAALKLHPDRGGSAQQFNRLTEARALLEARFGKLT